MKRKYLNLINYIYLAIVFIWQSIQMTLFEGLDGAGRLISLVTILIFLINIIYNKHFFSDIPIKIWMLWFLYASINTFFLLDEGYFGITKIAFIMNPLFVSLIIMNIVASQKEKKIEKFLKYMEYILYIVMIIYLFGSEFDDGLYSNELFNINELVLIINALIATILINSIRINRSIIKIFILMILPTYYIIMAGSRMGFGIYLILIFGFLFVKQNKNKFTSFFKLAFISILSFFLFNFIIDNTVLGERLMGTTSQSEELKDNTAEGTIFEFFGDRGLNYINGWRIFKEHPLFGIGLLNYSKEHMFILHTEYMTQLAELGIMGFLLYIFFLYSIFVRIYKKIKKQSNKKEGVFLLFILLSILFSASVLFLYRSYAIAYLFGLIILLSKNKNHAYVRLITRSSEYRQQGITIKKNLEI